MCILEVSFRVSEITSDFTGQNWRRSRTPAGSPQRPSSSWDITMEDQTKESCHLRPSSVALCQDFSLKWALSAHRSMGSIERCKTVQKWMCYDPRERNPVEPRTSDVLPTSPRTHTVPGTAGDGHNGEPLQCFGKNPDFTGLLL